MKRKGTDTSFKTKVLSSQKKYFFSTCFLSLAKSVISISTSEPHYHPLLPACSQPPPHQNLHAGNLVCVSLRPRSSFALGFLNFSFISSVAVLCHLIVSNTQRSRSCNPLLHHTSANVQNVANFNYQLSQSRAACRFSADELYMCPNLKRERGGGWCSPWLHSAFFLGYWVISVFPGVKFYLSSESFLGSTSGQWSMLTSSSSAQMSSIKQHIRARCCRLQPARSSACVQQHASASGYWQARWVRGVWSQHSRTTVRSSVLTLAAYARPLECETPVGWDWR